MKILFVSCYSDESEMTLMMNGTGEGIGNWCQFVYLIWLASKLTVFLSLSLSLSLSVLYGLFSSTKYMSIL